MIIGHEKIFETLKAQAKSGKIGHAQVFIGPEHIGKTRIAMELAVILQGAEENPALRKQILSGHNPDTILFLDEGSALSIEEIRGLIERAGQSYSSKYLIFIIENLGRMRPEAMNAILKTLEEPPAFTKFFLTVNREEDLLPTIASRAQITRFQTVPDEVLKLQADSNDPSHLLMFAMGRPGKFIKLSKDRDYFELHLKLDQMAGEFLTLPSIPKAFALSRELEESEYLTEFLDVFLHKNRLLLLRLKANPVNLEKIDQCKEDLQSNVNKKLCLENLFLSFTQ